jgi:hypothetical protein
MDPFFDTCPQQETLSQEVTHICAQEALTRRTYKPARAHRYRALPHRLHRLAASHLIAITNLQFIGSCQLLLRGSVVRLQAMRSGAHGPVACPPPLRHMCIWPYSGPKMLA